MISIQVTAPLVDRRSLITVERLVHGRSGFFAIWNLGYAAGKFVDVVRLKFNSEPRDIALKPHNQIVGYWH